MKKNIFIIAIALTLSLCDKSSWIMLAQQDVQFTQYMFNTVAVNPGYTGSRDALSVLGLYRNQWAGFEGAPTTQMVNINSPAFKDRLGLGLTFINEKIGPTQQTGLFGDVAYRIKLKKSYIAFGIRGGADFYQVKLTTLNLINGSDQQFQNNVTTKILPNFGAGAYYYTDKFYFGFSTPRLVENEIVNRAGTVNTSQLSGKQIHFYFIAGYVKEINQFIKFKPTLQTKITYGAPVSIDVNASFLFYEKLWVGAMYRMGDAVGALLQFQFSPQLRAGYSYDFTISKLRSYSGSTHEIMLGYDFSFFKEKIKSPRYF
ncbi:MAG: type IX secretion system membrane protein PorP/SprF [Bacteroidota bacterium]